MAFGFGAVIQGIAGFGKSLIETKDAKNARQHTENMADGQRITKMDDNDAAYAIAKLREQSGTWKDEVALITVLIPAWLAFIKVGPLDGPAIVKAGMEALGETPLWYQGLLTGAITGALGLNEYAKHKRRSAVSLAAKQAEAAQVQQESLQERPIARERGVTVRRDRTRTINCRRWRLERQERA